MRHQMDGQDSHFAYSLRTHKARTIRLKKASAQCIPPKLYGHTKLTRAKRLQWGADTHASHRQQTRIYFNWPHKRLKSEWICNWVLVHGFVTPKLTSIL